MVWKRFDNIPEIPLIDREDPKTYSITADVISYRRCPRQYLLYRERGFVPPNATQFYFGTVVHQTLDVAHSHYRGYIEGVPKGSIPSSEDLYKYFRIAENGLFASGIRPFNHGKHGGLSADNLIGTEDYDKLIDIIGPERASAFYRIRFFNDVEGENLYPRVIDTECRIDADQKDFIITGTVDVITTSDGGGRELWDYKSLKPEDLEETKRDGRDARMQMRIYAHIYNQRTGIMPTRGVIYSLGSIDPRTTPQGERPDDAIIEISDLDDEDAYAKAIDEFNRTVREIEKARQENDWPGPSSDPGKTTCDSCPRRWECPYVGDFKRFYPPRYP